MCPIFEHGGTASAAVEAANAIVGVEMLCFAHRPEAPDLAWNLANDQLRIARLQAALASRAGLRCLRALAGNHGVV